jgi:GGDEF domain-containing protein
MIAICHRIAYNECTMNRRILTFYYIISILFLLFILLFAAYRLKITVDGNREKSRRKLEALRVSALSVYLAEGGFDTEYFTSTMRDRFAATDRLLLLAIYSPRDGIHYLISKDRGYLAEPPGSAAPGSWEGKPEYTLRPVYENLYTLRFGPGIQQDLYIDGIFQDLRKAEVYPILREIFYVVLVYLLIASVFLLAAATTGAPGEAAMAVPRKLRREPEGPPSAPSPVPDLSTDAAAGLFSPTTGLVWSEHLEQRLSSELERAAASDQDLSVLLISTGTDHLKLLARQVLEAFPLRDLVFEYDSSTVAVILPDRDLDQSLREAREFQEKLPPPSTLRPIQVSIGLSARNGRLVSSNTLLTEVARALKQAEAAGGGKIIAFRADPDKYRAAIAASRSQRRR